MTLRALLIAISCGTLVLASPPSLPRPTGARVLIRMTADHAFDPRVITLRPGDEVTWRNDDQSVHSVVCDPWRALHREDIEPPSPPELFHSEDLKPGQRYSRGFSLEGVYRYVCGQHEEHGMNGTLIVKGEPGDRP